MSPGNALPVLIDGDVVRGLGRGGKLLGCPTANLNDDAVERLPANLANGVYFGLACVEEGQVHRTSLSIGTNPHFGNEKRTLEVHLLDFEGGDFYGKRIKTLIIGFIRPMKAFHTLDALISAISEDNAETRRQLSEALCEQLKARYFS